MIAGIEIDIAGTPYTVPAITLAQFRRLKEKIAGLGERGDSEQIDTICEIAAAAMSRNYPDITAERLADLLDTSNAGRVLSAALGGRQPEN